MPIYPVKGFSLTVPVRDAARAPVRGGICEDSLIAWCPLDAPDGPRMRITTGAVFSGQDAGHTPADFRAHREQFETLFPGALAWDDPRTSYWACQRPMTPSSLPILCKEFVIDECQLDLARAHGADAVLLIARCLEPERFAALMAAARERELEVLAEVHAPEEVPVVLDAGATLVGVNARDLDTLVMNAEQALRVLHDLPGHVTRVHLSGLHTEAHVRAVAASRADAALIGESLMREDEPSALLARLVAAGTPG